MRQGQPCRQQAGYSLVEISLAMLVAAMGIMAVFALFPTSLDASRRAADATETAAFADCVFASLENAASAYDWNNFQNNRVVMNRFHGLYDVFGNQPDLEAGGDASVYLYYWKPFWYGNFTQIQIQNYQAVQFTYTLDISSGPGGTQAARLKVWPGDVKEAVESTTPPGVDVPGGTVFIRYFVSPRI